MDTQQRGQFGHGSGQGCGAGALQQGRRAGVVVDADAVASEGFGHVDVEDRITHHDYLGRRHIEFIGQAAQHPGVGLGHALFGAPGGLDEAAQSRGLQRPLQPGARFAGGHRQPASGRRKRLQQGLDALERDVGTLPAAEVVPAVGIEKLCMPHGRKIRHDALQDFAHAKPNQRTDGIGFGRGQAQAFGRLPDGLYHLRDGIGNGAVPVEHDHLMPREIPLCCRTCHTLPPVI